MSQEKYEYVALIDESGDPGLRSVKPIDPNGSSEWLVVAAVIYRRTREDEAIAWGQELMSLSATHQTREFSFAKLPSEKQKAVCVSLAGQPARVFVVASNKKNMRHHRNPFAEKKSVTLAGRPPGMNYEWFYYWMTRILLEKVTDWVFRHSVSEFGAPQKLRLVYSERGGMRYDELGFYYELLHQHDVAGTQHIPIPLKWEVMHRDLLEAHPHNSRPELNLCDTAASAFFAACDRHDRKRDPFPAPAKLLRPCIAHLPGKKHTGYGVKLMPSFRDVQLDKQQCEIFRFYGYSVKPTIE